MKKNRFIKLMMAKGFQRNEVEKMAQDVRRFGSYNKLYVRIFISNTFGTLHRAIYELSAETLKCVSSFELFALGLRSERECVQQ